jgi:hypothetical protein
VVVCGASLESLDRGVSRPGYWSESRKSRIDAQPALECRQGDAETSDRKAGLKLAGLISRHLCLYLLNMCGAREVYSAGMRSILHRAHDYAAEHVPRLQFPQQRLPPATMCSPFFKYAMSWPQRALIATVNMALLAFSLVALYFLGLFLWALFVA